MSRDPSPSLDASVVAEELQRSADMLADSLIEEIRELRRSVDALAAVILVASGAKLDGVSFREARPMGPDYVGQAEFVKLVREEFEEFKK